MITDEKITASLDGANSPETGMTSFVNTTARKNAIDHAQLKHRTETQARQPCENGWRHSFLESSA
jgi:hypothetical protein